MNTSQIAETIKQLHLKENNLGVSTGSTWLSSSESKIASTSPVDGKLIGHVESCDNHTFRQVIEKAEEAFLAWRRVPAPKRGDIVRQIGNAFREQKEHLGKLVSYEMGKSYQEGLGEVQEMIDICDFSAGLSRQLHGLTMHSERPDHRMYEQYHPLGLVGIISAFNFPVAVWSWNSAIAWVCGNVCIWKPSEKTPLCSLACQHIVAKVFAKNGVPEGVSSVINGDSQVGRWLSECEQVALVSATGSTRMGRSVAQLVAARLGRVLLELGGNNAIIITEHANIDMAVRAALFGAVGTAGQRCTSTRRLIIQDKVYNTVKEKLKQGYEQLRIGNPLDPSNHVGPLIDASAVNLYREALQTLVRQGGQMLVEGAVLDGKGYESGCYVKPAIAEVAPDLPIVQQETFAPILYLMRYPDLPEAIAYQNGVKQGLSSAIMTTHVQEMEAFLSAFGSDCGIANVNVGTSGAEIGGAFGGEKETGGGRESGSDAWKNYMRRQTNTINYSNEMPLAQGIQFDW